jgi:hypothetical protein
MKDPNLRRFSLWVLHTASCRPLPYGFTATRRCPAAFEGIRTLSSRDPGVQYSAAIAPAMD